MTDDRMADETPLTSRVDLPERLQAQQVAINDLTRQAMATLDQALGVQQRSLDRYGAALDRHAATLEALHQRQVHQDTLLERLTGAIERLDVTMTAIKDLLERRNGH